MLGRYSPERLIGFARRLDPGLDARDFADAGRQLDQIDDEAFARYGLTGSDVAALRERFAAWPRTPEAAERQIQAAESAGRGQAAVARPARNRDEPGPASGLRPAAPERDADAGLEDPELGK